MQFQLSFSVELSPMVFKALANSSGIALQLVRGSTNVVSLHDLCCFFHNFLIIPCTTSSNVSFFTRRISLWEELLSDKREVERKTSISGCMSSFSFATGARKRY